MYLTLNISSKEVRLLAATKKQVQYWSSKELLSGWIKGGNILDPTAVGATIKSLFESAKISPSDVVICVTGLPFTYRILKLPPIKQSLLRDSIKHFMSKEMSMPTEQMCLSWAVIDENDDEITFFVLGVDQQIVDAVAQTMREAKIRHWTMDLKSLALARAASQYNAIVVSVESDCYDIVLLDNGNVSTMHTVSREEVGYDNIEHTKQLVVEISKAIAYDSKKHGRRLSSQDTPLLITGELSGDENLRDSIQLELGYPVEPLTPQLALQPELPVHLYSTNIGLALKHTNNFKLVPQDTNPYNDLDLDILSGRYARPQKRLSAKSLLYPAALTIVIGLVMPIYWANVEHDVESLRLQNELTIVNQQLQTAKLIDEKAREIESKTNEVYGQLANLEKDRQALLGNQGEFAVNLGKVINALPSQGYFTNLNISPELITVEGHADNAFQVVDYTSILDQGGLSSDIRIEEIGEPSGDEDMGNSVTFKVIATR